MPEAVIVATARTPIGRAFKGSLVDARPDDLGAFIVDTLMNKVPGGAKKGLRVLAKEEQLAFDLLAALSPEQKKAAVIAEKSPAEIRATPSGAGRSQC